MSIQQKIVGTGANGQMSSDLFGNSVAIRRDTAVVGSENSYDENGANFVSYAGAAFVFTRSAGVWSMQQKLVGTGVNGRNSFDNFGGSVSISGDSIIVGATGQDYDENGANFASSCGAAYVFTRTAGVWSTQQKLVGGGINGRCGLVGYSVDINSDTIIIGAPTHTFDENGANSVSSAGAAYVYTRAAGVWSMQQKLVASGSNDRVSGDKFGYSVAIDGNTVAIAAAMQDYDSLGNNLISDAGATYVFTRSTGVWTQQQKLVASGVNGRVSGDKFGYNVSVSENGASDGYTIIVGMPYQDYTSTGGTPATDSGAIFVFH